MFLYLSANDLILDVKIFQKLSYLIRNQENEAALYSLLYTSKVYMYSLILVWIIEVAAASWAPQPETLYILYLS